MDSDVVRLLTERRLQELRNEADRWRLVQASPGESRPRRRDALLAFVNLISFGILARPRPMAAYLDIHEVQPRVAVEGPRSHEMNVSVPSIAAIEYQHAFTRETDGQVCCLVDAPNKRTAEQIHREAHGLVALHAVRGGAGGSR